jgi:C4-dicarboxylate transporter DctM subunit
MNLVLLLIGLFLETQAVILLLTPFLVPIANNLGMPLVVLGMIIVINTSVGMITPPLAVNVFVASGIAKVGPEQITYKILPYLAVLIVLIFIFTYIPQTLTFFPTLLGLKL